MGEQLDATPEAKPRCRCQIGQSQVRFWHLCCSIRSNQAKLLLFRVNTTGCLGRTAPCGSARTTRPSSPSKGLLQVL